MAALVLLAASACVGAPPPPPGAGGSGSGDGTTGTTDTPPPPDTTGGPPDRTTGDESPPETTDPGTTTEPSETTTGPTGGAVLSIAEGATFDFGSVGQDESLVHQFVVTNVGDAVATGMSGVDPGPSFGYTGGAYPGAGGTCGDMLGPGDSCQLELEFIPADIGLWAGVLTVVHDDGDVSCDLGGLGTGQSANLIVNGGGEMGGSPPVGWTNTGVGLWIAGDPPLTVNPAVGGGCIYAADGPSGPEYVLAQQIGVDAWVDTIDAGLMSFSFSGLRRSLDIGNDEHRIRVRYVDEMGGVLLELDTGFESIPNWQMIADTQLAPGGTRAMQVLLGCQKVQGALCSAYYDELQLYAVVGM